jgi:hypothetical protein
VTKKDAKARLIAVGKMPEAGILDSILRSLFDVFGLSCIPGLEEGGYLSTMISHTSLAYFGALLASLGVLVLAWLSDTREDKLKDNSIDGNNPCPKDVAVEEKEVVEDMQSPVRSFEISPTDECEFVPLVSHEEDRRIAEELAPKTKYIPLDPDNPGAHLNVYLNTLRGENPESEGSENNTDSDDQILEKASNFETQDISQYVSSKDLHVLDDPRESPSRRGNIISRVKKARQRAIRNLVEKDMTADDHLKESMAANQMLSRVYTMMRENKELFGNTSFEDVKSQMDLYKA